MEVDALLRVVDALPMEDDAAEAELVGSGLRDKFTMSEMESVAKRLVRRSLSLAAPVFVLWLPRYSV